MTIVRAPWTPEQVEALNKYQNDGWMHPFTCCGPGPNCRQTLGLQDPDGSFNDRMLIATEDGWICPTCDRTQDWAHEFMFHGPPGSIMDMMTTGRDEGGRTPIRVREYE